jgi:hypothetical protein
MYGEGICRRCYPSAEITGGVAAKSRAVPHAAIASTPRHLFLIVDTTARMGIAVNLGNVESMQDTHRTALSVRR